MTNPFHVWLLIKRTHVFFNDICGEKNSNTIHIIRLKDIDQRKP